MMLWISRYVAAALLVLATVAWFLALLSYWRPLAFEILRGVGDLHISIVGGDLLFDNEPEVERAKAPYEIWLREFGRLTDAYHVAVEQEIATYESDRRKNWRANNSDRRKKWSEIDFKEKQIESWDRYRPHKGGGPARYSARLGLWALGLVAAIIPLVQFAIGVRRKRRQRSGLCVKCGYDLRASSEKCPECGSPKTGAEFSRALTTEINY